jgi:hypothetical protein
LGVDRGVSFATEFVMLSLLLTNFVIISRIGHAGSPHPDLRDRTGSQALV